MDEKMNFDFYHREAKKTSIYPQNMKVCYPALGLAGEAGEVCDKIKKVYRDNNGEFSIDKKQEILNEIGDVLWYMVSICDDLGYTLEDAAWANLKKIQSRQERNKIHGNGDNR